MAYVQKIYEITSRRQLSDTAFDFTILCPEIALQAHPGQFVHIRCAGFTLRRPISICKVDAAAGTIRIVFEVRGKGTQALSLLEKGSKIDLLGPLGRGFDLLSPEKKAVLVGGGIGTPPLLSVAAYYGENAFSILGFRSKEQVILFEDFSTVGSDVQLATDDGSRGFHGFTTQLLENYLKEHTPDIIYTCGPTPMLKGVADLAKQYHIRCQVSLEERMGCGVGACLVCACKTKTPDGEEHFSHVCKDGPVFEAKEVVFGD